MTHKGSTLLHSGAYTYDGAGRLTQVADSITSPATNEAYVWYNDSSLSSYPLPGNASITVQPDYDEDGNLVKLSHFDGTNTTTAYEYGYAYDGKRRWKKDYAGSSATWYPCGVACAAGELAELSNTIDSTGSTTGTWVTSALFLPGGAGCGSAPVRRRNVGGGDEYHHADLFGVNGVITNGGAAVISSNLYDQFGVFQYPNVQGQTSQINTYTFYRFCRTDDDGLLKDCQCSEVLPIRSLCTVVPPPKPKPAPPTSRLKDCSTIENIVVRGLCECDNNRQIDLQPAADLTVQMLLEQDPVQQQKLKAAADKIVAKAQRTYRICVDRFFV